MLRHYARGLVRFFSKYRSSDNAVALSAVPLTITAACPCSSYSAHQNSRHMQKLLNKKGGKTTKKRWYEPYFAEPLEFTFSKARKGPSQRQLARVRQVSHVLYDKISHLINSGEFCQDLLEKQINITSVELHKDMNGINVYWEADRSDWEQIEKILDAKRGKLRSILISYHVLGRIPPITFIKAKQVNGTAHLSHLLQVADYGPDYIAGQSSKEIPAHQRESDQSQRNIVKTSTSNTITISLQRLTNKSKGNSPNLDEEEKKIEESQHAAASVLPDLNFRSDLYGLQRDDMMRKIVAKKKGLAATFSNSDDKEMGSMSLRLVSIMKKNSQLSKAHWKQKTRKEESKMKSKLLDRDAPDFF